MTATSGIQVLVGCSKRRRIYDFTFAERFGSTFARQLAGDFKDAFDGFTKNGVWNPYRELRCFLGWLGHGTTRRNRVVSKVCDALLAAMAAGQASQFSEDLYQDLCEHYAQRFRRRRRVYARGNGSYRISQLHRALTKLSKRNALPNLPEGLSIPKKRHYSRKSHPPLAALTKSGAVAWSNSAEWTRVIDSVLVDNGFPLSSPTLDDRVRAITALNERRLDQLRALFEGELLRERKAFERGSALLAHPDLPTDEEIFGVISGRDSVPGGAAPWFRAVVGGDVERGIATALRYYRSQGSVVRGGFPHCLQEYLVVPEVRTALEATPKTTQHALQRMLSITPVSLNAAFGLLLIDTGWNPSPLAELTADPFVGTVEHGQCRLATAHVISAYKARARHDVQAALPVGAPGGLEFLEEFGPDACVLLDASPREGISGYEAVRLVQRMTAPIRSASSCPDRLWLCPRRRHYAPRVPEEVARAKYWRQFLARVQSDPVVGGLPIRPAMIRKTRLDIIACRGPAGPHQALAVGQHVSSVSLRHYQNSPWIRHSLLQNIRVFQDAFEAMLARGIRGIEAALRISRRELEARVQFAIQAGLGALGVASLGTPASPPLDVLAFVPTKEALLRLHVVDIALSKQASTLARSCPQEWREYWYPLFIRTKAVIRALDSTPSGPDSERARHEVLREQE